MESSTKIYYSRLDHLRFLAALIVLVWHSLHVPNIVSTSYVPSLFFLSILEEGHTGVSLFMVLSGFVFYAICKNKEINYLQFIKNRIFRIFPLFIVWTLFHFYVNDIDVVKLVVSVFSLINKDSVPGVGWTIIVEFQFYVIFPFVIIFIKNNGMRQLFGLVFLAVLFRWGVWYTQGSVQKLSYWTIFGRIDQFLLGMIACEVYFRYPKIIGRYFVLVGAALIWLLLYHRFNVLGGFFDNKSYPSSTSIWIYLPTLEGFFYSVIIASYMAVKFRMPKLIDDLLSKLGELSYSLYLNHIFIVGLCSKICIDLGWKMEGMEDGLLFTFFVVLPILVVVSLLTYRLIEQPFLKMRGAYVK